ncbi:MAG: hypothetical protein RDU89_10985 [bacterium]|nr:hypothetical protein [bacterium]
MRPRIATAGFPVAVLTERLVLYRRVSDGLSIGQNLTRMLEGERRVVERWDPTTNVASPLKPSEYWTIRFRRHLSQAGRLQGTGAVGAARQQLLSAARLPVGPVRRLMAWLLALWPGSAPLGKRLYRAINRPPQPPLVWPER